MKQRTFLPAVLCVLGGAVVAASAFAAGRIAAAPTAVASIDIQKVLEKISARADTEVEISRLASAFEKDITDRSKDLEARLKATEAMTDPAQIQSTRDALALENLQLREWTQLKGQELDRERALRFEALYREIRSEAQKLAQVEGYDYVLVNDGAADMKRDPRSKESYFEQVQQQIARRRVLVASAKDDITDKLVLRMNNNRAAATQATPKP
jgi:Skp family chaperone for outer membrane proteins